MCAVPTGAFSGASAVDDGRQGTGNRDSCLQGVGDRLVGSRLQSLFPVIMEISQLSLSTLPKERHVLCAPRSCAAHFRPKDLYYDVMACLFP